MTKTTYALLAIAIVSMSACRGFYIAPVTPMRATAISAVTVDYDPALPNDRMRMLDRFDVAGHMQRALAGSFPAGPGPRMHVVITEFRSGRWGPTRMHATAHLIDPSGAEVSQLQGDATAVMHRADRPQLIQMVAQQCVEQIAGQL